MFDPIDNDLKAMTKALRDVVMPALEAGNPIAQQQLKLVIEGLDFLQQRAPAVWRLAAFELSAQTALARQLLAVAPAGSGAALAQALQAAEAARGVALQGPAVVRQAVTGLEDALAQLVRDAATMAPASRQAIERLVVAGSKGWLDAQRAWYAPLSIEPDPAALPGLDCALHIAPSDYESPTP